MSKRAIHPKQPESRYHPPWMKESGARPSFKRPMRATTPAQRRKAMEEHRASRSMHFKRWLAERNAHARDAPASPARVTRPRDTRVTRAFEESSGTNSSMRSG